MFCSPFQRWNNGGYGSYDVRNEKAKLYRSSKDQVIIESVVVSIPSCFLLPTFAPNVSFSESFAVLLLHRTVSLIQILLSFAEWKDGNRSSKYTVVFFCIQSNLNWQTEIFFFHLRHKQTIEFIEILRRTQAQGSKYFDSCVYIDFRDCAYACVSCENLLRLLQTLGRGRDMPHKLR